MQLGCLSEQQHQLLAALQHVMSKDPAVAPLSGCDLNQYRSGPDQALRRRSQQAEGKPFYFAHGKCIIQALVSQVHAGTWCEYTLVRY